MAIFIIGTVGVPACYGGFETLVENLLDDQKVSCNVYCSSRAYERKIRSYKGASLIYVPLNANGAQSVLYDVFSILHALFSGGRKFLILGVSGAIILPFVKWFFPSSYLVTNIDGLEWRRDKWSKPIRRFLKFSERLAVRYSDVVVTDNQGIADYVLEEYGVGSEVIAYGGDHALLENGSDMDVGSGFALALCRIEPENNVHTILEAFAQCDASLVFIGNWQASIYGSDLYSKYAQFENITLLNPIYDVGELYAYRKSCGYYVHGHSAGGTNPSLVEIMHFAKPILAFDCIYNRATMEDLGNYFSDSDSLLSLLQNPICSSSAQPLKDVAQRRYRWDVVSNQYFSLFGV